MLTEPGTVAKRALQFHGRKVAPPSALNSNARPSAACEPIATPIALLARSSVKLLVTLKPDATVSELTSMRQNSR